MFACLLDVILYKNKVREKTRESSSVNEEPETLYTHAPRPETVAVSTPLHMRMFCSVLFVTLRYVIQRHDNDGSRR